MAKGLGTDIIEIGRIERIILRYGHKFLDRLFTKEEQSYCLTHKKSSQHFAGRFSAKEAVVKSLGTGLRRGITWLDIEIINDEKGKPQVKLSPMLSQKFDHPEFLLSISHSQKYATAVAIRV
ncbi:MAG: holo-ACP synthase [Waddliaceae bacterium]